jgi:hypothetical protein
MSRLEAYLLDCISGVVFSVLGSPFGYLVFLITCVLYYGQMPHAGEFALLPNMVIFEFPVALVIVPVVRGFISSNRTWWYWALGCFVLGAILNPVSIILLLGVFGLIRFPFF